MVTRRVFAGKATLTGRGGQGMNVPKKAMNLLKLRKGDLLLVYVDGDKLSIEPAERRE